MSYYSEIVERIQKEVKKVDKYPPSFTKKFIDLDRKNCYAYALNLNINDPEKRVLFPGCISDENEDPDIYSETSLMKRLKRDLNFLGFSYRENDIRLKEGEYRIAIYAFPTFHDCPIGFHISRQDKDCYWSEKPNWKASPRRLDYNGIDAPDIESAYFKTVLIIRKG